MTSWNNTRYCTTGELFKSPALIQLRSFSSGSTKELITLSGTGNNGVAFEDKLNIYKENLFTKAVSVDNLIVAWQQ
jgi:hypothetical protein